MQRFSSRPIAIWLVPRLRCKNYFLKNVWSSLVRPAVIPRASVKRQERIFKSAAQPWAETRGAAAGCGCTKRGGKRHDVPANHKLDEYLEAHIDGAGLAKDPKGPLFRTAEWKPAAPLAVMRKHAEVALPETIAGSGTGGA